MNFFSKGQQKNEMFVHKKTKRWHPYAVENSNMLMVIYLIIIQDSNEGKYGKWAPTTALSGSALSSTLDGLELRSDVRYCWSPLRAVKLK